MRNMVSLALLVAAGVFAAGCEAPVPGTPTYAADVLPIFEAHCVRCHGAGGTLNDEYATTGPITSASQALQHFATDDNGYLNQYGDTGTCAVNHGIISPRPGCMAGAKFLAVNGILTAYQPTMPPKPAVPFDDWESDVVNKWIKNPVCDTPANSSPSICAGM